MGFRENKAVRWYYRLDKKEQSAFAQALKGKNPTLDGERLGAIVAFLSAHTPDHPDLNLDSLVAVHPELPRKRIPPLLSKMKDELMHFFAVAEMERHPGMVELFALRQMRKRDLGWDKSLQKKTNQAIDSLGEEAETYLMKYWLEWEHLSVLTDEKARNKRLDLDIAHVQYLLGCFHALEQVTHLCDQASLDRIRQPEAEERGSEALILEKIRLVELRLRAKRWPLLAFYLDLLDAVRMEQPVPNGTQRLHELKEEVSATQHQHLWVLLHNVFTGMLNQGMNEVEGEFFELLKIGFVEKYVWTEEGHVRPTFYKNLMESATRCGKTDEGRSLIETYRKHLPRDHEGTYWLCIGIADFADKDFEAARKAKNKVLQSERFDDLYFRIGASFLEAKIHYETGEFERLISDLDRMKQLIYYQVILSESHRATLKKRFRYFNRLCNFHTGSNPLYDRFIAELEADQVDDKAWLLEKAVAAREAGQ